MTRLQIKLCMATSLLLLFSCMTPESRQLSKADRNVSDFELVAAMNYDRGLLRGYIGLSDAFLKVLEIVRADIVKKDTFPCRNSEIEDSFYFINESADDFLIEVRPRSDIVRIYGRVAGKTSLNEALPVAKVPCRLSYVVKKDNLQILSVNSR